MIVSVVVVNWNGRQWLERCFTSLYAQRGVASYQVVLVDNGSTDGSPDWVTDHFPQTQVIQLDHNAGFARANNIGIAASDSKYVALLNNDTEVDMHWLAALVDAAEGDGHIGSCAAQIVLAAQPATIDSAGIGVDRLGFAWQRGHMRPAIEYATACDVFGASGAAALYRREMLDRISLFDAEFESYYEDVDLAWRAQRAGWRCRYVPQAHVKHVHSATGGRDPAHKHKLLTRNRWWTLFKNMPARRLGLLLPLIVLADAASLTQGLWRTRSGTPLVARIEALRGMKRMWRKRGVLH